MRPNALLLLARDVDDRVSIREDNNEKKSVFKGKSGNINTSYFDINTCIVNGGLECYLLDRIPFFRKINCTECL